MVTAPLPALTVTGNAAALAGAVALAEVALAAVGLAAAGLLADEPQPARAAAQAALKAAASRRGFLIACYFLPRGKEGETVGRRGGPGRITLPTRADVV